MGDLQKESTVATPQEVAAEMSQRAERLTKEIERTLGESFRAGWISGYCTAYQVASNETPPDRAVIRAYTRFLAESLGGDPGIVRHVEQAAT